MIHTALTGRNPRKKPTIFTSFQTTRHLLLSIPRSIEKRLSILLSSKDIFQESAIYYEKCQPKENNQNKKNRKRKTIWFNLIYSKSVKTNIGRIFIKLIGKHFPPNHKFVRIFKKNTIKLSYSWMPNIRSKINGHNKKILQPKPAEPQK